MNDAMTRAGEGGMKTMVKEWGQAEQSMDAVGCIEASAAIATCLEQFTDACTPRPPQPEWFEKWDSWWMECAGREYIATFQGTDGDWLVFHERDGSSLLFRLAWIKSCVPVAREGFPAAVGWGVVGVKP